MKDVVQKSIQRRGGMETRVYKATLERGSLEIVQRQQPDGKLEQFMVSED